MFIYSRTYVLFLLLSLSSIPAPFPGPLSRTRTWWRQARLHRRLHAMGQILEFEHR